MANIKTARQKQLEEAIRRAAEIAIEHKKCGDKLFRRKYGYRDATPGHTLTYSADPGDVKRCPHGTVFEFLEYKSYGFGYKYKTLDPVFNPFRYRRAIRALAQEEREQHAQEDQP